MGALILTSLLRDLVENMPSLLVRKQRVLQNAVFGREDGWAKKGLAMRSFCNIGCHVHHCIKHAMGSKQLLEHDFRHATYFLRNRTLEMFPLHIHYIHGTLYLYSESWNVDVQIETQVFKRSSWMQAAYLDVFIKQVQLLFLHNHSEEEGGGGRRRRRMCTLSC